MRELCHEMRNNAELSDYPFHAVLTRHGYPGSCAKPWPIKKLTRYMPLSIQPSRQLELFIASTLNQSIQLTLHVTSGRSMPFLLYPRAVPSPPALSSFPVLVVDPLAMVAILLLSTLLSLADPSSASATLGNDSPPRVGKLGNRGPLPPLLVAYEGACGCT